jgi:translocation and assembly module TamB
LIREDTAGLTASFLVTGETDSLLFGTANYPIGLSLDPPMIAVASDESMAARIESQTIQLRDFASLVPPGYGIEGTCRFQMEAHGKSENPDIEGSLVGEELKVSTSDGTWLTAGMDLVASGTGRKPEISGRIDATGGIIRLPEQPRNLHPTEGPALLWKAEGDSVDMAVADTLVTSGRGVPSEDGERVFQPQFDIAVVIPGELWLRGRRLDVELEGDLSVQYREAPVITGQLNAAQGQLYLLGRSLSVDKGEVIFFGKEEINPTLDISLSTKIDETLIRVNVVGTLNEPELNLSSEPEMTEADIMSYLVLGRPTGEIDDSQSALVKDRAAEIAAVFSRGVLQEKLGQQFGVDMVSIQQGSAPNSGDALIIGKYLSPDVLLKYEVGLKSGAGSSISLQYLLTRHFQIETLMGQRTQSGVMVNWKNDY